MVLIFRWVAISRVLDLTFTNFYFSWIFAFSNSFVSFASHLILILWMILLIYICTLRGTFMTFSIQMTFLLFLLSLEFSFGWIFGHTSFNSISGFDWDLFIFVFHAYLLFAFVFSSVSFILRFSIFFDLVFSLVESSFLTWFSFHLNLSLFLTSSHILTFKLTINFSCIIVFPLKLSHWLTSFWFLEVYNPKSLRKTFGVLKSYYIWHNQNILQLFLTISPFLMIPKPLLRKSGFKNL